MSRYIALLRGINVGGKNLIKMPDLRACFEENGFLSVVTYIQSGNVIFESEESSAPRLTQRIETMLGARSTTRPAWCFERTRSCAASWNRRRMLLVRSRLSIDMTSCS